MQKSPTGIVGLDAMLHGGMPQGRVMLVQGGTGTGKTVLALQTLIHGVLGHDEPGIFVTFEESTAEIVRNASSFGWDIEALGGDRLFMLDARPDFDLIRSGQFDIGGLLAGLEAKVAGMGARRIVFDAIDVVMALLGDSASVRREIYRLHSWLLRHGQTAMITAKSAESGFSSGIPSLDFAQFMVDCSLHLRNHVVDGVAQRNIRVCKYRGSAFEENEVPFVFDRNGLEVAFSHGKNPSVPASNERISSGIDALDHMLGGGYFRGASILLTGSPGTAKTTLCGAFIEAACRRGEKALFVSFDSRSDEILRNLESVSIRLGPYASSGLLRIASMRALDGSAETHLMRIRALAREHGARCIVTDPLSALSKSGNRGMAPGVAERLIDGAKADGMTIICTSLLDQSVDSVEGTPLQISTIADTWIHLSYVVHSGERNRGLSIVKSRGTGHSNQVRELVLADHGVGLSDVFTAGGEVLMGSLRWEQEWREQRAAKEREAETALRRTRLLAEAGELEGQIALLKKRLEVKRQEEIALLHRAGEEVGETARTKSEIRAMRGTPGIRDDGNAP